ncbi:uncharacterized protein LOC129744973 isoform X2 [Uranotaenia lowii]|uniref:uncharacterized protein LOC129744973 isoform X2 n=1 Tax=Uranotaenia lowii TaxID=190385 RepID=UPI00247ADD3B|nr:uncharacterized protein LOC129744973 isoform X2 [Uranotaenia lowii]
MFRVCIVVLSVIVFQAFVLTIPLNANRNTTEPQLSNKSDPLSALKQWCVDTSGSDAGFRRFISAVPDLPICLINRIDFNENLEEVQQFMTGDFKPFLKKICSRLNNALSCYDWTIEGPISEQTIQNLLMGSLMFFQIL